MTTRKKIEAEVKDTIGYKEAANKESFMIGVSVAISKMEDHYEKENKNTNIELEGYKTAYNTIYKDIKSLTDIISRYSGE